MPPWYICQLLKPVAWVRSRSRCIRYFCGWQLGFHCDLLSAWWSMSPWRPSLEPLPEYPIIKSSLHLKIGYPQLQVTLSNSAESRLNTIPHVKDRLQWRHNEHHGILNYRRLDGLPNRLFRLRLKNVKAPHHWHLCGEFPHKVPIKWMTSGMVLNQW